MQTDWIGLINQAKADKAEVDNLKKPTDWKGISELTQYGMYGAVILLMGAFLFDVYEQEKSKTRC